METMYDWTMILARIYDKCMLNRRRNRMKCIVRHYSCRFRAAWWRSGTNRALSWLFSYMSNFIRLHYAPHVDAIIAKSSP